jgi:hypothetical protein
VRVYRLAGGYAWNAVIVPCGFAWVVRKTYRRAEAYAHRLLRRSGEGVGVLGERSEGEGDAEDELHGGRGRGCWSTEIDDDVKLYRIQTVTEHLVDGKKIGDELATSYPQKINGQIFSHFALRSFLVCSAFCGCN